MKVTIRRAGGALEDVEALPCGVPGLMIHPIGKAFGITHIRSGCSAGFCPDPEAALAAAADLGRLTDWTASGLDICDEISGQEVKDVLRRWGGWLSDHLTMPADRMDLAR